MSMACGRTSYAAVGKVAGLERDGFDDRARLFESQEHGPLGVMARD
jgi:hypothetical protein